MFCFFLLFLSCFYFIFRCFLFRHFFGFFALPELPFLFFFFLGTAFFGFFTFFWLELLRFLLMTQILHIPIFFVQYTHLLFFLMLLFCC